MSMINQEDEEMFLRTLNKKGFFLEDKTWKLLTQLNTSNFERNGVIDYHDERIEVDFWFKIGKHHFIIECKKTDYSWIFPRALERDDRINLIYSIDGEARVKNRPTSDFKTSWFETALMFGDDGKLQEQNNTGLAQTSFKDVHLHVRQILKNSQAYISRKLKDKEIYIPIIVTNAKLGFLNYSKGDLDGDGNLNTFASLDEVPMIAYNFAEVMKLDRRVLVYNKGNHEKTVFIINVNHLIGSIRTLCDQEI